MSEKLERKLIYFEVWQIAMMVAIVVGAILAAIASYFSIIAATPARQSSIEQAFVVGMTLVIVIGIFMMFKAFMLMLRLYRSTRMRNATVFLDAERAFVATRAFGIIVTILLEPIALIFAGFGLLSARAGGGVPSVFSYLFVILVILLPIIITTILFFAPIRYWRKFMESDLAKEIFANKAVEGFNDEENALIEKDEVEIPIQLTENVKKVITQMRILKVIDILVFAVFGFATLNVYFEGKAVNYSTEDTWMFRLLAIISSILAVLYFLLLWQLYRCLVERSRKVFLLMRGVFAMTIIMGVIAGFGFAIYVVDPTFHYLRGLAVPMTLFEVGLLAVLELFIVVKPAIRLKKYFESDEAKAIFVGE